MAPVELSEVRCPECRKLLCRADGIRAIEIVCSRCGSVLVGEAPRQFSASMLTTVDSFVIVSNENVRLTE